jgi:hypothetical protein
MMVLDSSIRRVEIDSTVEAINQDEFADFHFLSEVVFASDSRLKMIAGFRVCKSLRRIEIPSSVE